MFRRTFVAALPHASRRVAIRRDGGRDASTVDLSSYAAGAAGRLRADGTAEERDSVAKSVGLYRGAGLMVVGTAASARGAGARV